MESLQSQIFSALRQARSIWANDALAGVSTLKELLAVWPMDKLLPQEEAVSSVTQGKSTLDQFRAACEEHGRRNNWLFLRAWIPEEGGLNAKWMRPDGSIHNGQGWQCVSA